MGSTWSNAPALYRRVNERFAIAPQADVRGRNELLCFMMQYTIQREWK
jgi:hypothetical protein